MPRYKPVNYNPKTVAEDQEANKKESQLKLIIIIGALSAFGPLSIDMYLPGLPSLTQDLGCPTWQAQLTLTACLLGLAGGQILAGPLSDIIGRRRPLLAGIFLYTVTSLLCALAPSVPILIVLRLIQGATGAAGIVISRAMVRDLYSGAAAARFFAMTMAINGLAPILAPVIGGQLLSFTSWRGVFVVLTLIGIGMFLAALLGLNETLPQNRRHSGGISATLTTFGRLLTDRTYMGYALAAGFASAAMFAYIAGSPFVLEDIFGVSPQMFSLIFAVNATGIIIASQISGRLVGRVKPRKLLMLGLTGSLIGGWFVLVAIVGNLGLPGLLPAFFLVVADIGFTGPNATAEALADHADVAGSASALIGVLQFSIGSVVTPLVGIGGSATAIPMAIVIAVLSSAASLSFLLLTRPTSKDQDLSIVKS
ncbi:MAG TPA: multidrug effflux MFS transporter [Chloroflexia bacterium]|nr:multidrug effflux MFS transporter [Chloroflexia bacterium]